jgi:predicted enzyme related to lactoylglutathione lyase
VAERDGYIPGVPCWVDTSQPDPDRAIAFYSGLFGWECEDAMPEGSEAKYVVARIRGGDVAAISSIPEGAPSRATWNTYIWVDSADETTTRVREADGTVLTEPFDVFDAGRMAVFADPEGAVFCVWQAMQHKGARVVNEHGSLNFNNLNTRDPARAREFYGTVFDWTTLALPGGFEAWTLPGYGDYLERDDPGLRKRIEDAGADPGFVDVVATIQPLGDEQSDLPAHWSVTFATDDADESAAKANALGGTVVAAPFDAPWVRTTVLADPAGATFVASQFVPENQGLTSEAGAAPSGG